MFWLVNARKYDICEKNVFLLSPILHCSLPCASIYLIIENTNAETDNLNHRIKMNTEGSMQQIYKEVRLCTRIIDFKLILHDLLPYINHFGRIHKVSNNQF